MTVTNIFYIIGDIQSYTKMIKVFITNLKGLSLFKNKHY